MKLLAQTNRHYLRISLVALLISSALLFWAVRRLFDEVADERLLELRQEILNYVAQYDTLPSFFQSTGSKVIVQPASHLAALQFGDTTLVNPLEQEEEPYRVLHFGLQAQGGIYRIDLLQSAVETEDIAETVLLLNLVLLVALFLVLFLAQKRMSLRLWQPFHATIEQLRGFRLAQSEPLTFPGTNTDEFAELHAALVRLTEKTRQDYQSLKRFSENASHEIQTPLAIVQAKLETLLQTPGLNDEQLTHLSGAQRAINRLSRLQQNLLLLVKIENDQFQTTTKLEVQQLVENKLAMLEDFIEVKGLRVETNFAPVEIQANPFLAEMVISNLLGNAVKHNLPEKGWLSVHLQQQQLIIKNAGSPPGGPVEELFERFRRSGSPTEGLGLGLAIAREICDQYGWLLTIEFSSGTWTSTIFFGKVG